MLYGYEHNTNPTNEQMAMTAFKELVEAIMEGESGRDIDAGCGGDGPLAHALVILDMAPDTMSAADMIFGPDEFEEEFDAEGEDDAG